MWSRYQRPVEHLKTMQVIANHIKRQKLKNLVSILLYLKNGKTAFSCVKSLGKLGMDKNILSLMKLSIARQTLWQL